MRENTFSDIFVIQTKMYIYIGKRACFNVIVCIVVYTTPQGKKKEGNLYIRKSYTYCIISSNTIKRCWINCVQHIYVYCNIYTQVQVHQCLQYIHYTLQNESLTYIFLIYILTQHIISTLCIYVYIKYIFLHLFFFLEKYESSFLKKTPLSYDVFINGNVVNLILNIITNIFYAYLLYKQMNRLRRLYILYMFTCTFITQIYIVAQYMFRIFSVFLTKSSLSTNIVYIYTSSKHNNIIFQTICSIYIYIDKLGRQNLT